MKLLKIFFAITLILLTAGCSRTKENEIDMDKNSEFKVFTEQFADLSVLRYKINGFDQLSLKEKELLYYLYQAALSGRDIFYDQNYKHNLRIRRTLEAVVEGYNGDRSSENFKNFMIYTKRVWFSNGIHHHYSNAKFLPEFPQSYFGELVRSVPAESLPLENGETLDVFIQKISSIIFDPSIAPLRASFDPNADLIKTSANNYYEGLTQKEVEEYYRKKMDESDPHPISYGLNSKLVKENGVTREKAWKLGGMYTEAIEKIIFWLEKAAGVAENQIQKSTLEKLIEYYKTGNLKTFDDYNITWVKDTISRVDAINGFIETYGDPLNYKASFEAIVSFKDLEATKRIDAISRQAQWFEDNSPIMPQHKKKKVTGISAKVITVVVESGDASPSTPIGINLPNANWIRKEFGSKSVNLGNIIESYVVAESDIMIKEFGYTPEVIDNVSKHSVLMENVHTDMHEVIGHASGQLSPGVGAPRETLKSYASVVEEARADLVALYYILDPKLVEIGVLPSLDAGKAAYDRYILNGLMLQLRRIKLGDNLEQAHMKNRQLISNWVLEKGGKDNVVEKKTRDGKTYFVINNYQKLRTLFGLLLREVQRISSEGDYKAAQKLVETYGVKVDQKLLKEALDRFKKLNIPPYRGFINPVLVPEMKDGKIVDVKVEYPDDFTQQMLFYAKNYSFLPNYN